MTFAITCARCESAFVSRSYQTIYCPSCRLVQKRDSLICLRLRQRLGAKAPKPFCGLCGGERALRKRFCETCRVRIHRTKSLEATRRRRTTQREGDPRDASVPWETFDPTIVPATPEDSRMSRRKSSRTPGRTERGLVVTAHERKLLGQLRRCMG